MVLLRNNNRQLWGIIHALEATVVPARLRADTGWGVDVDELLRVVGPRTRLIAICNPNNPTGAVLSEADRKEIVAVAARHGAWILSDEVYRGAERDGKETATFWGSYDRLVVTGGLSKAYGLPGLRIGWVRWGRRRRGRAVGAQGLPHDQSRALSDRLARAALRRDARIFARTRGILAANYRAEARGGCAADRSLRFVPPRAGISLPALRLGGELHRARDAPARRAERPHRPRRPLRWTGSCASASATSPDLRAGLDRIDKVLDRLPAPPPRAYWNQAHTGGGTMNASARPPDRFA